MLSSAFGAAASAALSRRSFRVWQRSSEGLGGQPESNPKHQATREHNAFIGI
jgi:hypothetical protein